MGPGLNPFEPTFDDLVNLSTELGTVNLYCQVKYNLTNASNYAIWLVGYFDGSKAGGATFGLIMLVVDVVTFIIGLPGLWAIGKSVVGLLKAGWEALKKAPAALAKLQVFLIQKARAFATAVTDLGTAIAEKAGVILKQVGGSLARAADAARAVARDIAGLRRVLAMPTAATDAEVLGEAARRGVLTRYGQLSALGADDSGNIVKMRSEVRKPPQPPNRGFTGPPIPIILEEGQVVSRYGPETGKFVSPVGTPPAMRSLPPETDLAEYYVYEVRKPFRALSGQVAPYWGQDGLGIAYDLPYKIEWLLQHGYLRRIP